jgi:hypothetical protein
MSGIARFAQSALLLSLAASACDRQPAQEDPGAGTADPAGVIGGVPPERIERDAQAMSPEQAEQLGIVDTTIHMENLGEPGDTVPPPMR